jgi:hypothetical protein
MPNSGVGAEPSDRTCLNARPRSRSRMVAPQMRWILGVVRPRIVEAQRASQRDVSLQSDWARDVPSSSVESELRRESEAAGNQPVSILDVSLCSKKAYNTRSGGGGNCTRNPLFVMCFPNCTYVNASEDAQGMCRDCVALQELVAAWHGLTPEVRETIMGLVRSSQG